MNEFPAAATATPVKARWRECFIDYIRTCTALPNKLTVHFTSWLCTGDLGVDDNTAGDNTGATTGVAGWLTVGSRCSCSRKYFNLALIPAQSLREFPVLGRRRVRFHFFRSVDETSLSDRPRDRPLRSKSESRSKPPELPVWE